MCIRARVETEGHSLGQRAARKARATESDGTQGQGARPEGDRAMDRARGRARGTERERRERGTE